jgi:hypothetical protein
LRLFKLFQPLAVCRLSGVLAIFGCVDFPDVRDIHDKDDEPVRARR